MKGRDRIKQVGGKRKGEEIKKKLEKGRVWRKEIKGCSILEIINMDEEYFQINVKNEVCHTNLFILCEILHYCDFCFVINSTIKKITKFQKIKFKIIFKNH
jgi:hypothetical protein